MPCLLKEACFFQDPWINPGTMNLLLNLFGEGKDLTVLQMSLRAFVVFIAALLMLRVTGQRTFGQKSAMDNVVMIMLGAILSRAVTGSSPFLPVIAASLVIVVFHRLLGWLTLKSDRIGNWIKGERVLLFRNGKQQKKNMDSTLLSHKDVMEGIRVMINEDDTENISEVYLERSGEVSVIKKKKT